MYCEKCTLKSNRVQCIRMWYVTKNILVIRDAWKYYNLYSPGPHRPIALKMDIILLRRLVQNFIFMHKNFPPEQLVSETISFWIALLPRLSSQDKDDLDAREKYSWVEADLNQIKFSLTHLACFNTLRAAMFSFSITIFDSWYAVFENLCDHW